MGQSHSCLGNFQSMLLSLSGINEHRPSDAVRPCEHQPDLEMCGFLVAVGV